MTHASTYSSLPLPPPKTQHNTSQLLFHLNTNTFIEYSVIMSVMMHLLSLGDTHLFITSYLISSHHYSTPYLNTQHIITQQTVRSVKGVVGKKNEVVIDAKATAKAKGGRGGGGGRGKGAKKGPGKGRRKVAAAATSSISKKKGKPISQFLI